MKRLAKVRPAAAPPTTNVQPTALASATHRRRAPIARDRRHHCCHESRTAMAAQERMRMTRQRRRWSPIAHVMAVSDAARQAPTAAAASLAAARRSHQEGLRSSKRKHATAWQHATMAVSRRKKPMLTATAVLSMRRATHAPPLRATGAGRRPGCQARVAARWAANAAANLCARETTDRPTKARFFSKGRGRAVEGTLRCSLCAGRRVRRHAAALPSTLPRVDAFAHEAASPHALHGQARR